MIARRNTHWASTFRKSLPMFIQKLSLFWGQFGIKWHLYCKVKLGRNISTRNYIRISDRSTANVFKESTKIVYHLVPSWSFSIGYLHKVTWYLTKILTISLTFWFILQNFVTLWCYYIILVEVGLLAHWGEDSVFPKHVVTTDSTRASIDDKPIIDQGSPQLTSI